MIFVRSLPKQIAYDVWVGLAESCRHGNLVALIWLIVVDTFQRFHGQSKLRLETATILGDSMSLINNNKPNHIA
jgi:hypothetical protein